MFRFTSITKKTFSHSLRFLCTRPTKFGIGDVEQFVKVPKREEYVPRSRHDDPFLNTMEARSHLRWMMQKDELKQDMLLMGENMGEMRRCVLEWLRLGGREYEYVSLSQDTAHEDLRQRRELCNNSSEFKDQAAVRAAIEGRVLLLEGVDRVERNILPLLNNLLENREISLEDGRILLPPHRVNTLTNPGNTSPNNNIVAVHPDFRVIGLMRVHNQPGNSNSVTTQLDPPLRSRFQARFIPSLSASSLLEISHSLAPRISKESPVTLRNFVQVSETLESAESGNLDNLFF